MKIEDYTPQDAQSELLELITKAARRCAYDLRHAANTIRNNDDACKMYDDRAEMWLSVFNPDNGPKNYRAGLHDEIWNLESRVAELEKLCEKNGIHYDKSKLPF